MDAQCFTVQELGLFIRTVVENSFEKREMPATFPSASFVHKLVQNIISTGINYSYSDEPLSSPGGSVYDNGAAFSLSNLEPGRDWYVRIRLKIQEAFLATKEKRANTQQSNNRTNVSTLVSVNADGGFLPPFFIFPGVNICERKTRGVLKGSVFASSKSSFLTTPLFIQYFEWFVRQIPPEPPVILVMDGYKAHFSAITIKYAVVNDIHLYAIPAHTSHFLQPLDVTVFQHFERELDKAIGDFEKENKYGVSKRDIAKVASIALPKCFTRAYTVDGFEKTGIFPLNQEVMLKHIISDSPQQRRLITIVPTMAITERSKSYLKRQGLDPDTLRVVAINRMQLEDNKRAKRTEANEANDYVHGSVLMTYNAVVKLVEKREAEKLAKVVAKKTRDDLKVQSKAAKLVSQVPLAQRKKYQVAQRAVKEAPAIMKRAEMQELKLVRGEDKLSRMLHKNKVKSTRTPYKPQLVLVEAVV